MMRLVFAQGNGTAALEIYLQLWYYIGMMTKAIFAALVFAGLACGQYIPPGGSGIGTTGQYLTSGASSYWLGPAMTVPPSLSAWTWINQGSATETAAGSAVLMASPASASDSLHCLVASSYPATPWANSWTIGLVPTLPMANYGSVGIVFTDGTKLLTMAVSFFSQSGGSISASGQSWTNVTTNSATLSPLAAPYPMVQGTIFYLTVNDDGTNIDAWLSTNPSDLKRVNFVHVARGAFISGGPTKVGLFVDSANSATGVSMLVVHWAGPVV